LFNVGARGLLRIDWVTAMLVVGIFLLSLLAGKAHLRRSLINILALVFAYSALFSILSLLHPHTYLAQFVDFGTKGAQFFISLVFFFSVSNLGLQKSEAVTMVRLWLGITLLLSLYALYQVPARVYGWDFANFALTNPSVAAGGGEARVIYGFPQVNSIFREPSYLGAYLLAPTLLLTTILLRGQGRAFFFKHALFNWGTLAVLCLAMLVTSSQGAYLSLAGALGIVFLSGHIDRKKMIAIFTVCLVVLAIVGLILSSLQIDLLGSIALRFKYLIINMVNPDETTEITSFKARSECITAAFQAWSRSPLLGVGLNNMSYNSDLCDYSLGWSQLVADQGIAGILSMLLVITALWYSLTRLSARPGLSPIWATLCLAMSFVLVSDFINGFFAYNWTDLQRWSNLAIAHMVLLQARSSLSVAEGGNDGPGAGFSRSPLPRFTQEESKA
jgi:hypothetical protein